MFVVLYIFTWSKEQPQQFEKIHYNSQLDDIRSQVFKSSSPKFSARLETTVKIISVDMTVVGSSSCHGIMLERENHSNDNLCCVQIFNDKLWR